MATQRNRGMTKGATLRGLRAKSIALWVAAIFAVAACGAASQSTGAGTSQGPQDGSGGPAGSAIPIASGAPAGGAPAGSANPAGGIGPVTAVTGDAFSACALLSDGSVSCWGNNVKGELGNGSTNQDANVMAPPSTVIGLGSGVRAIAASGYNTNCALLTSGTVKCWGAGALGTGVNQYTVAATPADVPSVSGATALFAVGAGFCVIATGGAPQCWGSTFSSDLPVTIAGLSNVVAMSGTRTDAAHICAVAGDGSVKCWGDNEVGQLGNGSTSESSTPVDVVGLSGVKSILTAYISGGNKYSCAVTSAGGVKCWGTVPSDASTYATPVAIAIDLPGFLSGVQDLFDNNGQLGLIMSDGSTKHVGGGNNYGADLDSIPAAIQSFSTLGKNNPACVLTLDGRVLCRSFTSNGDPWPMVQGLVIGGSATGPAPTPAVAGNVVMVSLAGQGGCVVTTAGGVKCWGVNPGNGSTVSQVPVDVLGLTAGVSAVSVASDHTCALTVAGGVKCWGTAALGADSAGNSLIPVDVSGLASGVKRVYTGSGITCAITTSGGVKCWGASNVLPLSSPSPVDVAGLSSGVSDMTFGKNGGNSEICALISGTVSCWANATSGKWTWRPVPGLGSDNSAVASGGACALTRAGGLKCWDSTVFFSGGATDLAGMTTGVASAALGWAGGCAIMTAGGVRCWGGNLGNGTTDTSATPVDVPGLTGVTDLSMGRDTCVVTADQVLKCWGTVGTAPVAITIP